VSRWRDLTLSEIERRWQPGDVFTRTEWLEHSMPAFRNNFPDNNTLSESAQRVLQDLRDDGLVEFLGRGTYRVPVRAGAPIDPVEAPNPPDGIRRGRLAHTIYEVLATSGHPMRSAEVLAEVADGIDLNDRELSANPSGQARWRAAANAVLSWSTFSGWLTRDEDQRYTITESGAEALEELSADDLWLEITRRYQAAKRDESTHGAGWDGFLFWAHELTSAVDLDAEEREYKLKAAQKWSAAGRACANGDDDWADRLKQASGAGNLVDSFAQMWLRNRIADRPDALREAVGRLHAARSASAVDEFAETLGSWEAYISPGDRTVFASCVLLGVDSSAFAPYRPALGKGWADRIGVDAGDKPGQRFAALLALCDRLLELWDGPPELRDRLDAQGLGWAVLKWEAPATWSPLRRAELDHWREGRTGDIQVERGTGIRPDLENAAWKVLGPALRGETSILVPGVRSWTVANAQELLERFATGNPGLGFTDRLGQQLRGASNGALCLAAELLYVRDAPLHDMKASTKLDRLSAILGVIEGSPPISDALVAALSDGGSFAGGQGYHVRAPEHLTWLCRFVLHWLDQPSNVVEAALRDPFAFREVTTGVPDDSPSIRYVVEYIAWPGVFPSVVSGTHRRKIRDGLIADVGSPSGDTDAEITRDLVALRVQHDRKVKGVTDWYRPPFVNRWRPGSYTGPRAWLVRADDPRDVNRWQSDNCVELRDEAGLALEHGQTVGTVQALVDEGYAHLATSQRTELATAFHNFLDVVQEDDLIVTLAGERLLVGTVDDARADGGPDSALRRPVLWHSASTLLGSMPAKLGAALEQEGHLVDLTAVVDLVIDLAPGDRSAGVVAVVEGPRSVPRVMLPPVSDSTARELYMPVEPLQELVDLLNRRRQLVVYGPPGTGKTYVAKRLAEKLAGAEDPSRVRLLQFHPSYAYEDFFEGFRPVERDGRAHFSLQDGPLKRMALEAAKPENSDKAYILIIDELNRANLAKVFGELYFLLEYRQETVRLQYQPEQPFSLPDNLFLIGTMNTADRSIALVDAAIRRRFPFYEMHPDREPVKGVLAQYASQKGVTDDRVELLAELNEAVGQRGHDLQIGPSYLMRDWLADPGELELVWRYDILPLLHEHFYGMKSPEAVDEEFGIGSLRRRIARRTGETRGGEADLAESESESDDR
jgi:5-methylcytosine-specific restriction protein B